MINQQWPIYSDADNNYVRALPIDKIVQYANGQASIQFAGGYAPVEVDASFMTTWQPQKGGYLITVPGEYIYMSKASFEATYTATGGTSVTPGDIAGATTTGVSVLTAADKPAARAAIDAAGKGINAAGASDINISAITYDANGIPTLTMKIGDGKISNRSLSSAGLSGNNIKTVSTVTSAGGTVTIPAGTDHDAALKILADAVDPAAG